MEGIAFSEVWRLYRASGMNSESPFFSIGYRKMDGTWGEKKKVRRAASRNLKEPKERKDVGEITKEVRRAGNMKLETETGERFEIKALGLIEFNGRKVDHRF